MTRKPLVHRRAPRLLPLLGAALAVFATGLTASAAWAQDAKSRSDVKAETRSAIARGDVSSRGDATAPEKEARPPKSTTARASVKADTRAAIASGDRPLSAEGSPTEKLPRTTTQPRAEVKADARAANKAGKTQVGEAYPDRKP